MALQKITRSDIEKMHRSGALKAVGSLTLGGGKKVSGAAMRDYLVEKIKTHNTPGLLQQVVRKETTAGQWRQRKILQEAFKPAAKISPAGTEKKSSSVGGWFGSGKKEKPKPLPYYRRDREEYDLKTGTFKDTIAERPTGMAGGRPENTSIGLGSRLEQAKKSQTSALDTSFKTSGGQAKGGFKTIHSR